MASRGSAIPIPSLPDIGKFRSVKLGDLSEEQLSDYVSFVDKALPEIQEGEHAAIFENEDTIEPLFHIHNLCKAGRLKSSKRRMKAAQVLMGNIFGVNKPEKGQVAGVVGTTGGKAHRHIEGMAEGLQKAKAIQSPDKEQAAQRRALVKKAKGLVEEAKGSEKEAKSLEKAGNHEAAKNCYSYAARTYWHAAEPYAQLGNLEKAATLNMRAAELYSRTKNGNAPFCRVDAAKRYKQLGNLAKAAAQFSRGAAGMLGIYEFLNEEADAHMQAASLYVQLGNTEAAAHEYSLAGERHLSRIAGDAGAKAFLLAADLYVQLGNLEKAATHFARAANNFSWKNDTYRAFAHLQAAELYKHLGNLEAAAKQTDNAAEKLSDLSNLEPGIAAKICLEWAELYKPAINPKSTARQTILTIGRMLSKGEMQQDVALALIICKPDWSEEQLMQLRNLLPPGGEVSKNKFTRAIFLSFMEADRALQVQVVEYCLSAKNARGNDKQLLALMSLSNSLGKGFVDRLTAMPVTTFEEVHARTRETVVDMLSANYSRKALEKMDTGHLIRYISVFPEFEQSMKLHKRDYLIPALRLLATVEALGREGEFGTHDPKLAAYLKENAQTLFPNEQERNAILESLNYWASMKDEKSVFGTQNEAEIRRMLKIWLSPTVMEHTLNEISAVDRIEDCGRRLDDVFLKGHFSQYLLAEANMQEGAQPLGKVLADMYRARKAQGAPPAELDEINVLQHSQLIPLQSIFLKYGEKLEALQSDIQLHGAALAPYADLLSSWGFDYGDSFGNKVFRGELRLLSAACSRALLAEPKNERLLELNGKIARLEGACKLADDYLLSIADALNPSKAGKSGILSYLEAKSEWAQSMHSGLSSGTASLEETLLGIRGYDAGFHTMLSERLENEPNVAAHQALVQEALLQYTEQTAITDLGQFVAIARGEGTADSQLQTLRYGAQRNFSLMELALVGQCLDYRYSKNSIGNAPFAVSYLDPIRQMVVAYEAADAALERPKVDGLIFLSNVSEISGETATGEKTSIVIDRVYTPDATPLGWSKIEGHLKFAMAKAGEMGIPVVVPDHLQTYFQQIREIAADGGFTHREAQVSVPIYAGSAGATYCELESFYSYSANTHIQVSSLILEPAKR